MSNTPRDPLNLTDVWRTLKDDENNLKYGYCYDEDAVRAQCEENLKKMESVGRDDTVDNITGLEFILQTLSAGGIEKAEAMARKLLYDAKMNQPLPTPPVAKSWRAPVGEVLGKRLLRKDEDGKYKRPRGAGKKGCAWCSETGKWIPMSPAVVVHSVDVVETAD